LRALLLFKIFILCEKKKKIAKQASSPPTLPNSAFR
jgi:hypothetical protein